MPSIRVLCDLFLPTGAVRFYDGSGGIFVDSDGNMYRPGQFTTDALSQIEAAINGEAFTLNLSLINIPSSDATEMWEYDESIPVTGSMVVIKIQILDDYAQPVGAADVLFTGTINNLSSTDSVTDDGIVSTISVSIVNKFTVRVITSGSVLSDVDQKARALILNPTGAPDQFCERVPTMHDLTVSWPNW